jgi:GNAT superfamily N-acetyltransferase
MSFKFKICRYKTSNLIEVSNLIKNTFTKYNSKNETKKGVMYYINYYDPDKSLDSIKKSFNKSKLFFLAKKNNKIIGIIRGNPSRVGNLFIKVGYHNLGIGKKLFVKFEKECIKNDSKFIKARSSIYAIPFYEKMGFKKTTGVRILHGLKTQPMKKTLR